MLLFTSTQFDKDKFSEGYADLQWMASKSTPGGPPGKGRRKGRNKAAANQKLEEEYLDVGALDDFTNGAERELEAFEGRFGRLLY